MKDKKNKRKIPAPMPELNLDIARGTSPCFVEEKSNNDGNDDDFSMRATIFACFFRPLLCVSYEKEKKRAEHWVSFFIYVY